MKHFDYVEFAPPVHLSDHVECFWRFRASSHQERRAKHVIVPDGAVSIFFLRLQNGQCVIGMTGPSTKAHRTETIVGSQIYGIRIRPGVAGSVLKTNIANYRDVLSSSQNETSAVLNVLKGKAPDRVAEQQGQSTILSLSEWLCSQSGPIDGATREFADQIIQSGGKLKLGHEIQSLGVSERQMRRRFAYQCGLSPKEFSRLRRIRGACICLLAQKESTLSDMAMHVGFADQAHMAREFKDVFGGSVSLLRDYLGQIHHHNLVASKSAMPKSDRFLQDISNLMFY